MIEIAQGNPRLAGKIDQRQDEEYQRRNEQKCNAILMRQMQHGAHERYDDQRTGDDCAYGGIEYRLVQQRGPALETGNIRLEMRPGAIAFDDAVKELRAINYTVHARHQHGNKRCDRTEQKCRCRDAPDNPG
jgi:hypothetical protein